MELAEARTENTELASELVAMQDSLAEVKRQARAELEELEAVWKATNKALEDKVTELEAELATLKLNGARVFADGDLEAEVTTLKLNEARSAKAARVLEAELAAVQLELDTERAQHEAAKAALVAEQERGILEARKQESEFAAILAARDEEKRRMEAVSTTLGRAISDRDALVATLEAEKASMRQLAKTAACLVGLRTVNAARGITVNAAKGITSGVGGVARRIAGRV